MIGCKEGQVIYDWLGGVAVKILNNWVGGGIGDPCLPIEGGKVKDDCLLSKEVKNDWL